MKSNIDISDIQQILSLWKQSKITDSVSSKLMKLLFGCPEYLCEKNYYPIENFSDIIRSLKFRNLQSFVEALQKCKTFGVIIDAKEKRIVGIYSPLLFTDDPEKIVKEDRKNRAENKNNSQQLFRNIDTPPVLYEALYKYLYNINKKIYNNFSSNYSVTDAALLSSSISNSKKNKKKKKGAQSCSEMKGVARKPKIKKSVCHSTVDKGRKPMIFYFRLRRLRMAHPYRHEMRAIVHSPMAGTAGWGNSAGFIMQRLKQPDSDFIPLLASRPDYSRIAG